MAAIRLASMAAYYIICTKENAKCDTEAESVFQYSDDELLNLGDKAPTYRYKLWSDSAVVKLRDLEDGFQS